jgi:hypothetical protein
VYILHIQVNGFDLCSKEKANNTKINTILSYYPNEISTGNSVKCNFLPSPFVLCIVLTRSLPPKITELLLKETHGNG